MSLIDGIGDEVIQFFVIVSVVTVALIAWWSTGIVHRPLIRTVLIYEHRTRAESVRRTSNQQPVLIIESRQESNTSEVVENEPSEVDNINLSDNNTESNSVDSSEHNQETTDIIPEDERSTIVETMDSEANLLRKRRLAFLEKETNNATASSSNTASSSVDKEENDNRVNEQTCKETKDQPQKTDEVNSITIKLKYLNDDLKLVQGNLQEQLGDFKKRHFEVELASHKLVRLIFNGQVLQRDTETLEGCGLFDNCVVHCLVHAGQNTNQNTARESASHTETVSSGHGIGNNRRDTAHSVRWELGNVLFVLVLFVLSAAWYFRYEYAQLFTVTATVGLVCLTGIFTLFVFGMLSSDTSGSTSQNNIPEPTPAAAT